MKSIEVEIRGEISHLEVPQIQQALRKLGFRRVSSTKRVSVMSFGQVSPKGKAWRTDGAPTDVDVRCRVTNGKAEVVTKIGQTHASNRLEIAQAIPLKQLPVFAAMFASMGFFTKVGSKRTENYQKGKMLVSIVQSPSKITYVEMEILSDRKHEHAALQQLNTLAKELGIVIMKQKAFLDLCTRLTKQDDWEFHGTPRDMKRLEREVQLIKSDTK